MADHWTPPSGSAAERLSTEDPLPPDSKPEFLSVRTASRTVAFSHPFMLTGIGALQPAGTYTVETDEELVQGTSIPVYRRTATLMLLPPRPGGAMLSQIATIDPLELEIALERDALSEAQRQRS